MSTSYRMNMENETGCGLDGARGGRSSLGCNAASEPSTSRKTRSLTLLDTFLVTALLLMVSAYCVSSVEASPYQLAILDKAFAHRGARLMRHRRASVSCMEDISMRKQGLVIRKQTPDACDSFRTTLRGPDGKRLRVKLDHAILIGEQNFVKINDGQETWYVDKSCAPCHEEHIQGNSVTIEYRLSNSSRIQFRYTTNDNTCPFLTVMPPLKFRNKSQNMRDVGARAELECLNSRDFVLVGSRRMECVRLPNGSVAWSSPLPTCQRQSNCPKIQDNNGSGILELTSIAEENYNCNWSIDGSELDPTAKYIEFTLTVQPEQLVRSGFAQRSRGLTFYDGERRITVENGKGLRYRTRDPKLRINFHLSKSETANMQYGLFRVEFEVVRKTCPTIDEEAFPFGTITLSDGFFIGSRAKLQCAPGYDLRGDPEAACQKDANWTFGNAMPECVPLSAEADNDIKGVEMLPGSVESDAGPDELGDVLSTTTTDDPRTPKDVLAIKNWSIRPDKADAVGLTNEQHRTNIVPPRKIDISKEPLQNGDGTIGHIGDRSRKGNEVASNDDDDEEADHRRHIFVNPKLKTTTGLSTTTGINRVTTDAPLTSTLPPEDIQNKVQTSTSLVDRLLDLDLNNRQDISLLLVVLCASIAALVLLILLLWGLRRGCREKIPIRENPLYTGAPARRINNVSFRPGSHHKRAMQERTYT